MRTCIVFSGQANPTFFSELRKIYNDSQPLTKELIVRAAAELRKQCDDYTRHFGKQSEESPVFNVYEGLTLDLIAWLEDPSSIGGEAAPLLFAAPSHPLIALCQLAHFSQAVELSGETYEEFVSHIHGSTGHSQGIVTATCVSVSHTAEEFITNSLQMLIYLFWQGVFSTEDFPQYDFYTDTTRLARTPMATVFGITREVLDGILHDYNNPPSGPLAPEDTIALSLVNESQRFIVTGTYTALSKLKERIDPMFSNEFQDSLRFSQRKPRGGFIYLPISAPFHAGSTHLMTATHDRLITKVAELGIDFPAANAQFPIFSTTCGTDVAEITRRHNQTNMWPELIHMQLLQPVYWDVAMKAVLTHDFTHILDFGPGRFICRCTVHWAAGHGIHICTMVPGGDSRSPHISVGIAKGPRPRTWRSLAPTLTADNKVANHWTEVMKKPPVMVGAMTPTTVSAELVSAVTRAGYHVELACGGLSREHLMTGRIEEILSKVNPGDGVTLNMLYLNPKQWAMQFPLALELLDRSVPIDGVTIAAGVPQPKVAAEFVNQLVAKGVSHVGFKPANVRAIRDVIAVATACPKATIILQFTGGRAGGHHSGEHCHEPLLATYADIRVCSNILLVAGGGISTGADAQTWLTGAWAEPYGMQAMPVDAALISSRVMVTNEAETAECVKDAIVATPGLSHEDADNWEETYADGAKSGVLTVDSELGAPIHVVKNRGTMLWRDLDTRLFCLQGDEFLAKLAEMKEELIARLNEDYQKVYFGVRDGLPCDVDDMSYKAVCARMFQLMAPNGRFIHPDYADRTRQFLVRCIERSQAPVHGGEQAPAEIVCSWVDDLLEAPEKLDEFFCATPALTRLGNSVLRVDDVDFFLFICRTTGKPVNFIPCIDKDFKAYFKKDSLWYSECPEAIPEGDAGRVFILLGPVSAAGCTVKNEPVADVLNGIMAHVAAHTTAKVAPVPKWASLKRTLTVGSSDFDDLVSSTIGTPIHAVLDSKFIARGSERVQNPIMKALEGHGITVEVNPTYLEVEQEGNVIVTVAIEDNVAKASLPYSIPGKADRVSLDLVLNLHPDRPHAVLSQCPKEWISSVHRFYSALWNLDRVRATTAPLPKRVFSDTFNVTDASAKLFTAAVQRLSSPSAPMDYLIVGCWNSLLKGLVAPELRLNLFRLVHLSNDFNFIGKPQLITAGMKLFSEMMVTEVTRRSKGLIIRITGTVARHGQTPFAEIESAFFIRGDYSGVTEFNTRPAIAVMKAEESVPLQTGSYTVTSPCGMALRAPVENAQYSAASRDYNPIHTNSLFASIAGLPGCIVHGMWSSAAVRATLEACCCGDLAVRPLDSSPKPRDAPGRVAYYHAEFTDMVRNQDNLVIAMKHVGQHNGAAVIDITATVEQTGAVALKATAHVLPPDTAFVFTGQGSAKPGMGMDLYATSEEARNVWDEADRYLFETYGISLLRIVRENPKELTVHFGGQRGAAIRKNYMKLTSVKMVFTDGKWAEHETPLFPEITPRSRVFTYRAPKGLLYATQFTQPAIITYCKAAATDLMARQLIAKPQYFTGHSLGEYSALAIIGDIFYNDRLSELVFLRGMMMQRCFPRDESGRSAYTMVAVDPKRAGNGLTAEGIEQVCDLIEKEAHTEQYLLQVVNLNIVKRQLVLAGHLKCLETFTQYINSAADLTTEGITAHGPGAIKTIFAGIHDTVELSRTKCTVPLVGIDVPFHSRLLSGGVASFRPFLCSHVREDLDVTDFVGRYIPNLTGTPFSLDKAFFEKVYSVTSSPVIAAILADWEEKSKDVKKIGRDLLIELLTYQFASPVQWIRTQSQIFQTAGKTTVNPPCKRMIEVGPTSTLTTMAARTFVELGMPANTAELLTLATKAAPIVHDYDDPDDVEDEPEPAAQPTATAAAPAPVQMQMQAAPAPTSLVDAPLAPEYVMRCYLAKKLNKPLCDIAPTASIKDLVGGKSALQNEIVGELDVEFKSTPDGIAEQPIATVASAIKGYTKLGKHMTEQAQRICSAKLPAGFSVAKVRQTFKTLGLPPNRCDGAIARLCVMEPDSRVDAKDSTSTLKTIAEAYLADFGLSLPVAGALTAAPMMAAGPQSMPAAVPALNDTPVSPEYVMRCYLAKKLHLAVADVPGTATIKSLVGGKSALQNEIIGELDAEFKSTPDGIADLPLSDVAAAIKGYTKLGKYMSDEFSRVAGNKLPPGFGSMAKVKNAMADLGLPANRCQMALARMVHMEPDSRVESGPDFIKTVVEAYLADSGETLPVAAPGAMAGFAGPAAAIDNAALESAMERNDAFVHKLMDVCKDHLAKDAAPQAEPVEVTEDPNLVNEMGTEFANGVYPKFSEGKIRTFRSHWNWARVELEALFHDLLADRKILTDTALAQIVHHFANRHSPVLLTNARYMLKNSSTDEGKRVLTAIVAAIERAAECREGPAFIDFTAPTKPLTRITEQGVIESYEERRHDSMAGFLTEMKDVVGLYRANGGEDLSEMLFSTMEQALPGQEGLQFAGMTVLVTGAGKGSIGAAVIRNILSGGGHVIVTTSSFDAGRARYFQELYQSTASNGSVLTLVPFNQASKADVTALVDYLYAHDLDVDALVPFAAIPENGATIETIGSRSELAHRTMLTNIYRLIGEIVKSKKARSTVTRPCSVILPMSPNHGLFGNDGLYSESKLGLEVLYNRWSSEHWAEYVNVVGAVIGWTRGTGLMAPQNIVAPDLEKAGVRTFSQDEMALFLTALLSWDIADVAAADPVRADLTGGFVTAGVDIAKASKDSRARLYAEAATIKLTRPANKPEQALTPMADVEAFVVGHPDVPSDAELDRLTPPHLRGLLDFTTVPVIVGFGELGPYGGSHTRWDIEKGRTFSLEGCIELAWLMGLITHHTGSLADGSRHTGWIDAKTNEPVADNDVPRLYEREVLAHTGVRVIEPEALPSSFDPDHRVLFRQVCVEQVLPPVPVPTKEEAVHFKAEHGDKCVVSTAMLDGEETYLVQLLPGAVMYVPKALSFDRNVAGLIPTGWDPLRLGIPKDIIDSVDSCTVYMLSALADALIAAGIRDPYELYEYVHLSQVGNTIGSGMGGLNSFHNMFWNRRTEVPVQADILQETFINTVGAWINMLLFSSDGPIIATVGACATAAISLDVACSLIRSGRAKVVVAGGAEQYVEEAAVEFANMKATNATRQDMAVSGRAANEASRPCTTSRAGFVESHGAGAQIVMAADTALQMGVPIYAVVAYTHIASDRQGRSIPAPGQGILSGCGEIDTGVTPAILNREFRATQLKARLESLKAIYEPQIAQSSGPLQAELQRMWAAERAKERRHWGNLEAAITEPGVSAIRAALSVYGLTVDDLTLASFHGTSTKANDSNESKIIDYTLRKLGRTPGNSLPVVCQKWLTAHPKAAAAAWMMNGAIQALLSGVIPGNRNADDIDGALEQFSMLHYPNESYQLAAGHAKAAIVDSFGFGQAGAQVILVHPSYILSAIPDRNVLDAYRVRRAAREIDSHHVVGEIRAGRRSVVAVKNEAPYAKDEQMELYARPDVRATYSIDEQTWTFPAGTSKAPAAKEFEQHILSSTDFRAMKSSPSRGFGIDLEPLVGINVHSSAFISRNYTDREQAYCWAASGSGVQERFTGRWCAKEAVVKALSQAAGPDRKVVREAHDPLIDIEIVTTPNGYPTVELHGAVRELAAELGVKDVFISITHSGAYAGAVAAVH
ncbi:Acyl transferase domain [Carpediemonas membranifera]|uniref:Acyl transferase domain n=1 Tax=Carpediemonas membranifera TaxID=201153 RepID=A0A8J6E032_9EUKA|nr:Acyl transferase domain [Carpediemonas membranifera]|eukprot:KAG9394494.1 Acyl transferase domain [Carpediemonas membranifera]